ncbi:MAG: alanine racemase [Lentisphaerales bacterium]|nr:alanine racemase [Lentisphaerales bacterium]
MARNTLEIRLDLIQQNYQNILNHVSPLQVMCILKANAYGLGALSVARALVEKGVKRIGVADVNEALELKDLGVEVQLIGDLVDHEIEAVVSEGFIAPITSYEHALKLNCEAEKQNRIVDAQFLIDSGMGRLGIPLEIAYDEILKCKGLGSLNLSGMYSHFPVAYGDQKFSGRQVDEVLGLVERLRASGLEFSELHMANSDGIHNVVSSRMQPFNMVRTGINLYGYYDLEGDKQFPLQQVLKLKSKLISVRELPAGTTVGYGRTFTLLGNMKVGTVAIGYADGMPISLSNNGFLLVNGVKCPIVGRVSMDYTTIDVSHVEATSGDDLICLGDGLDVSEWAKQASTINYDIICSIGARVKRVYLND